MNSTRLDATQSRHNRAIASLRHLAQSSNLPQQLVDLIVRELEDAARCLRLEAGRDGWLRAARLYGVERTTAQCHFERELGLGELALIVGGERT